jgi:glycosyltransferase involved in cell wall biosynthesis
MNNEKQISVIMATYHGDEESYFIQSVESILNQTYRNLELILCVDGQVSAKRSQLIVDMQKNDLRVKAIHLKRNGGPARARNKGIASALGSYIAIMDADDISVPHRLERELSELKKSKVDIIGSSYIEFCVDNDNTTINSFPINHDHIIKAMPYFCPMASPTILGKASFFKTIPYREDLRVSEDYYLWIAMVKCGAKMMNIAEPLLYYRRGTDFSKRRRGFKYVRGDLIAKLSAISLLPIYMRPFILIFSILTTVLVRLSPSFIFNKLRNIKHSLAQKNI